jgi:hypothetical protein
MRLSFVVPPGSLVHLDVSVLQTIAHISIWAGKSVHEVELKYSLEFPGRLWHNEMSDTAKCDDAARIAIAHWLDSSERHKEGLHLVCDQDTRRWSGRLELLTLRS